MPTPYNAGDAANSPEAQAVYDYLYGWARKEYSSIKVGATGTAAGSSPDDDAAAQRIGLIGKAAYAKYAAVMPPDQARARAVQETGQRIDAEVRERQAANGQPQTGVADKAGLGGQAPGDVASGGPGGAGSAVAGNTDVTAALDTFRTTTEGAIKTYQNPTPITMPRPVDIVKPVTVAPVSPAQRFEAARQAGVTVEGTNTADLQATANGQGAGALAADARQRQMEQRSTQLASGLAQQARGADRKGARIAAIAGAGEQRTAGMANVQAQSAADRMAAQTKIADIDTQKKQTQATLDQARAAGDQNAINIATQKLAELDQQNAQFNSGQSVTVQTTNNAQGLTAQGQQETQRVANEELKIKMQDAAQKAAQGLLDENQRQENLAMARKQLADSEKRYQDAVNRQAQQAELDQYNKDRQFWGQLISSFVSGATTTSMAAVTSDPSTKENIEPVSDAALHELATAARRSLSTFDYKKGQGDGPGRFAFPMADALEDTELGPAVVFRDENGVRKVRDRHLAVLLALANQRFQKGQN